jgi:hypothetical protein
MKVYRKGPRKNNVLMKRFNASMHGVTWVPVPHVWL